MNEIKSFSSYNQYNIPLSLITFDKFYINFENQGSKYKNLLRWMEQLNVPLQNNSEFSYFEFQLNDIPNSTAFLNICFKKDLHVEEIDVEIKDNIQTCLEGTFHESSGFEINATTNISGTTLMFIWDKICSCLRVGEVELEDLAEISCKHCQKDKVHLKAWRILGNIQTKLYKMDEMPNSTNETASNMIFENQEQNSLPGSWYERFGYRLKKISENYKKAVAYLSTLTLSHLKLIFQDKTQSLEIVKNSFNLLNEPNDKTFLLDVIKNLIFLLKKRLSIKIFMNFIIKWSK